MIYKPIDLVYLMCGDNNNKAKNFAVILIESLRKTNCIGRALPGVEPAA